MSTSRKSDTAKTRHLVSELVISDGKTWLGHKTDSGAGRLDIAMLAGGTIHQLEQFGGRGAVDTHVHHLRNVHNITVSETQAINGDTIYRITS